MQSSPSTILHSSILSLQTKIKQYFPKHQKTHTPKYTKQRKLEEVKIQKLLLINNINHTREHTITYSCIHDIDNKNSRVDFLIEHTDNNSTYGLMFLEVDEHQHDGNPISCDVARMSKIIESLTRDSNTVPI